MKKKRRSKWCSDGGCLGSRSSRRDGWSSELDSENLYEPLNPEDRSKAYEAEFRKLYGYRTVKAPPKAPPKESPKIAKEAQSSSRPFESRPYERSSEKKPFESRTPPYERSSEKKPFESRTPLYERSSEKKPIESRTPPYERSSEKRPFESRPPPYERSSENRPFQSRAPPYERSSERVPFERESTTSITTTTTTSRAFEVSTSSDGEITEERLEEELRLVSEQRGADGGDYDAELLEKLIQEAEEAELLAKLKKQEEEEIARKKKQEEEDIEGWEMQPDLSWMSFTQLARNRARGISTTGERVDRLQRTDSERYDGSLSMSGRSTWSEIEDNSGRFSRSFSGPWHTDWRELDLVEGEEEEEEIKLVRNPRQPRGKELVQNDIFIDDGASSSTSEIPPYEWDNGRPRPYSFSPLHLQAGFQKKRKEFISTFEQKIFKAAKIPESKFYRRLHYAAMAILGALVVGLVFCFFLLYLSFIVRVLPPGACENDKIILNFSATRIRLRGGRYVSFREQGAPPGIAEHSVVVVHDLASSRLAGIPGVSDSLLNEYKVRLVSFDRPGYGQSDRHLGRSYNTSAFDILDIADALNLGEKFWVMGFGSGGPHVWAAVNYIPERLAGVALLAPAGNPYVRGMSREEIEEIWGVLTLRQKWLHSIARRFPALLPNLLQRTAISNSPYVPRNVRLSLGLKDQAWMEQPHIMQAWNEDVKESLRQGCAFPMAEELILLVSNWGFSLSELPFKEQPRERTIFRQMVNLFVGKDKSKFFDGPIHVWQGTDDQLVPVTVNNVTKRLIEQNDLLDLSTSPSPVNLHYLPGEGHYSWFWFCEECHRKLFQTLFRPNETVEQEPTHPPVPVPAINGYYVDNYDSIAEPAGGSSTPHDPDQEEDGCRPVKKKIDSSKAIPVTKIAHGGSTVTPHPFRTESDKETAKKEIGSSASTKEAAGSSQTSQPYNEGGKAAAKKIIDSFASTTTSEEEANKVLFTKKPPKVESGQHMPEATRLPKKVQSARRTQEQNEDYPMTCSRANEVLEDQRVHFACPEDSVLGNMKHSRDMTVSTTHAAAELGSDTKNGGSRNTDDRTGNVSAQTEGLSTLVQKIGRFR